MAPSLVQSQNGSVLRAAFIELSSFLFMSVFLFFSMMTQNDSFSLIMSPQFVIVLFMVLNTPLQIVLHLYIAPMLNPDDGADEYSLGKTRYGVEKIVKTVSGSLIAFIFVWVVVHIIAVLFGAHFVEDFMETTLWAAMVSSMVVTPGVCVLGPKVRSWVALFNFKNFDSVSRRRLYYCVVATGIGCWLSPVVVPLDWDRPWQLWPVPGVIGAILGYCGGLLISGLRILKEIKISKLQ